MHFAGLFGAQSGSQSHLKSFLAQSNLTFNASELVDKFFQLLLKSLDSQKPTWIPNISFKYLQMMHVHVRALEFKACMSYVHLNDQYQKCERCWLIELYNLPKHYILHM